MSSSAEKLFKEFNWDNNEWKKYFESLYPTPGYDRVDHFKRKWFKANIDSELVVAADKTEKPAAAAAGSQTSTTPKAKGVAELTPHLALLLGCICSLLYLIPFGFRGFQRYASWSYVLGFTAVLIREHGIPQLNTVYWQSLIMNEIGQTLFVTVASFPMKSWLTLVSPFLTSSLFLAKQSGLWLSFVPFSLQKQLKLQELIKLIKTQQYQIMQLRSSFEVILGFASIILCFFKRSTFLSTLFYWNTLRFKYQMDSFTQASFRQLDHYATNALASHWVPSVFRTAYGTIKNYLGQLVQTT